MFYSAVPPRSYAIVPNTLAASVPVLGTTGQDNYTNSSSTSLSRNIDYRNSLDLNKTFQPTRSVYSPHTTMSYTHISPVYSSSTTTYPQDYRTDPAEASLPFQAQESLIDLISQEGTTIRPEITCKIEKGFFWSHERAWTCYRRNYFSVSCHYTLEPPADGSVLYIKRRNEKTEQIETKAVQALAVSLSASVDGSNGKTVDLVQHTPKRDKGPQLKVAHTKLFPNHKVPAHSTSGTMASYQTPGYGYHAASSPHTNNSPLLPFQMIATDTKEIQEARSAGISLPAANATSHIFERIQFKNATANNGKRRAQQQYYHLIVELYADIRSDSSLSEDWVKVAQRVSEQVVVRGRSPSHYQNEGPSSTARPGGAGGMGGRNPTWGTPFQGHSPHGMYVSSSSSSRMLPGAGGYMYSGMPSMAEPTTSMAHNLLNPSGISGLESSRPLPTNLMNGRTLFTHHTGAGATDDEGGSYTYYPQALTEAGLSSPNGHMIKTDEIAHSGKSSSSPESPAGTFPHAMAGKYAGYETSKGYYPS